MIGLRAKPTSEVRYEQAVYGSFPFWDRGYGVLMHSPGCRPQWLAELRVACQRFGEPLGSSSAGSLFALRLPSGPWAIVGVSAPGTDDQGRPGALAFHALFVLGTEFRKARFDPFALAGALRRDWGPKTPPLGSGTCAVQPSSGLSDPPNPAAVSAAALLSEGRRVVVESAEPIDELARQVWSRLSERVRRRASVATLSFSNANRFDLVAMPRLTGVPLDASYINLREAPAGSAAEPTVGAGAGSLKNLASFRSLRPLLTIACIVALVAGLIAAAIRGREQRQADSSSVRLSRPAQRSPDRLAYRDDPLSEDERARVTEALIDLSERFGLIETRRTAPYADPTDLMIRFAERLRYHGPFLTESERARLAQERDPGRDAALAWHEQVRRFAADRPLPADFAQGTLRWQLDTLTWSFHLDADPRRSAPEVPHALGKALAVDVPIRPSPLAPRYPALHAYAQFLGTLPRR